MTNGAPTESPPNGGSSNGDESKTNLIVNYLPQTMVSSWKA